MYNWALKATVKYYHRHHGSLKILFFLSFASLGQHLKKVLKVLES